MERSRERSPVVGLYLSPLHHMVILVVNVPFEFILREGSFLEVDLNPSVLAQKTKTVIAT